MGILIWVILFIIVLFLYMWSEAYRNRMRFHRLQFEHLPDSFQGYKLFFISDLHFRLIPHSVITKIQDQVDVVIIGGDLCEKNVPIDRIEKNLKRLTSIAPTFFVWGNNDVEVGRETLTRLLKKYHVKQLNNDVVYLERNEEMIALGGVDDVGHRRDRVHDVIQKTNRLFSILISHYPSITEKLQSEHPFSLVLSGHTHGGQIRLFGLGLREKGKLTKETNYFHLISNGYGTTGVPLRLNAPAEMHIIELEQVHIDE